MTSRVRGGAPLQREGRLLLDGGDGGGVAYAERADAAGQRVLVLELLFVVRVGRWRWRRRRRLRWPLQRLQEVVRPQEETLGGGRRRRLGARELRQGGFLGGRSVQREEVVRRLISLEPHDRALHHRWAGAPAVDREEASAIRRDGEGERGRRGLGAGRREMCER